MPKMPKTARDELFLSCVILSGASLRTCLFCSWARHNAGDIEGTKAYESDVFKTALQKAIAPDAVEVKVPSPPSPEKKDESEDVDMLTPRSSSSAGARDDKVKPPSNPVSLIDLFVDNVGGAQLDSALKLMKPQGKILTVGAMSAIESYASGNIRGCKEYLRMAARELLWGGFMVLIIIAMKKCCYCKSISVSSCFMQGDCKEKG